MRARSVTLSGVGFSRWIPLDRYGSYFGVGLGVKLSSGAALTASVQHTFDDIYQVFDASSFSLSRSGTTATVTMPNHGLSVGDWIQVLSADAPFDGEFLVASVPDQNTFTYTVAATGATVGGPFRRLQRAKVFNHATLNNLTASADGNYAYPPKACRLRCTAYTSGTVELRVVPGAR